MDGKNNKDCINIPGYQPLKDNPYLITNIDRVSSLNNNMKCGKDKVCIDEAASTEKDIIFYIFMGVIFSLLIASIILIVFYFQSDVPSASVSNSTQT